MNKYLHGSRQRPIHSLHPQLNFMNQRVWVDVACKLYLLISQELHPNQIPHGVILLVDGQCARIRHLLVGTIFPFTSERGRKKEWRDGR